MHFIKKINFFNKLLTFCLYLIGLGHSVYATQWYQVSTPNFDILLQKEFLPIIQPLANKLEVLYNPWRKSMLNTKTKKVSLIFKGDACNQGTFQLGPRKITLHPFPPASPFFIGNSDWLEMLFIHEGRHRVQSDLSCLTMQKKFGHIVFYWGMVGFSIPEWFDEGDAVAIETVFSKSGRGRIPQFGLLYRMNLLERGVFGYHKQMGVGSYKGRVTNYYPSGYFLITYLRRKYGSQVIGEIYKNTCSSLLIPFAFPNAIKKTTGRTLLQIYRDAHQELLTFWKKQLDGLPITPAEVVHTRSISKYKSTEFIDYLYPQFYDSEHIIVYTSGIGTIPQLVLVNIASQLKNNNNNCISSQEIFQKIIFNTIQPPFATQKQNRLSKHKKKVLCLLRKPYCNYFSAAGEKIVWVETMKDPFKGSKFMHTTIQLYNIATRKCRQLTTLSRYNIAVLSPDATQIVAVESSSTYQHQLVILDANNGRVVCRIANPNNYYYMTPSWTADGEEIIALCTAEKKSTVVRVNIKTGSEESIYPASEEHISHPKIYGNYLFYNSSYSGIDNIYAMNLQTKQRFQVTSRKYGAYHPIISQDGMWILFNDFTKDGMDVVKIPFNPASWIPIEQVENRDILYYQPLVEQEKNNHPIFQPDLLNNHYPIKKYQPWKHWLNLSKLGFDRGSGVKPMNLHGSLEFQDVLEEMCIIAHYDFKEKPKKTFRGQMYWGKSVTKFSHGLLLEMQYNGWYPEIRLKGGLSSYRSGTYKFSGNITFPYYMQYGVFTQMMSLRVGLSGRRSTELPTMYVCEHTLEPGTKFAQFYRIIFSNHRDTKSRRDLDLPYAQKIILTYEHTPYLVLGNIEKQKLQTMLHFILPGLINHHSIQVIPQYTYTFKKLWKDDDRGIALDEDKKQILACQFSYTFPLFYPDWSEGLLFYLQHIFVRINYDYHLNSTLESIKFKSHIIQGTFHFSFKFLTFKIPLINVYLGGKLTKKNIKNNNEQMAGAWKLDFVFNFNTVKHGR